MRRLAAGLLGLGLVGATLLTAGSGEAAFPGRNGLIVFASRDIENTAAEVLSIDVATGAATNLSQNKAADVGPVPSPNGRLIAFTRVTGACTSTEEDVQDCEVDLYVMNRDGSRQRRIGTGTAPTWSPDSTRIAYERLPPDGTGLTVVRIDGAAEAFDLPYGGSPHWSPEGSWIAYVAASTLYLVRPDGSGGTEIAGDVQELLGSSWSPDGSRLAFVQRVLTPVDRNRLVSFDLTSHSIMELAPTGQAPTWSPDGHFLAYADFDGNGTSVFTVRSDGSNRRRLITDASSPAWSPDGARIAFERGSSGAWIVSPTGEGPHKVFDTAPGTFSPPFGRPESALVWTPDGDSILAVRSLPVESEIFTSRPDGGDLRQLTDNSVDDNGPAWSPDGRLIAFSRQGDLYVMRGNGSDVQHLTADPNTDDLDPAWSPDGTKIAFTRRTFGPEGARWVVEVLQYPSGSSYTLDPGPFSSGPAWSPDGRKIAYGRGLVGLVVRNLHTGRVRRLTRPGRGADMVDDGYPDWSPDGRRIAVWRLICNGDCYLDSPSFVAVLDLEGHVRAKPAGLTKCEPAWSPDGKHIRCGGDWQPVCTKYGTDHADHLVGTDHRDVICGEGGDDRIDGRGGNDVIIGGEGNDVIIGGPGKDRLFGAWGDDRILARDRTRDVVDGGPGDDRLRVDRKLDLVTP